MEKIEDQRILVWCNNVSNIKNTIIDAAYLAAKLDKELCLFACFTNHKHEDEYYERTKALAQTVKTEMPGIAVTSLVIEGKLQNLVSLLAQEYNVILLCFGCKMNKSILQAFYRAQFPFFFSKEHKISNKLFDKAIVPVDFRESTKNAALWGSYLGRFNNTEICLLCANDKSDNMLSSKVHQSVNSITKLFEQFKFNFRIVKGKKGSWGIHREAVKHSNAFDLLIFAGSFNVSLIDQVLGPFEKQLTNKSEIPVMLINPQKEMHVLCD
ncbi:MAG: hypothetical protein JW735_00090 [Prolixibacteraceae bacterium]|nr:hypothetical protein [Prolixibacteraceae bacterium]